MILLFVLVHPIGECGSESPSGHSAARQGRFLQVIGAKQGLQFKRFLLNSWLIEWKHVTTTATSFDIQGTRMMLFSIGQ